MRSVFDICEIVHAHVRLVFVVRKGLVNCFLLIVLVASYKAQKLINVRDFAPKDEPMVFVVGAMAHGKVCIYIYRFPFILMLLYK